MAAKDLKDIEKMSVEELVAFRDEIDSLIALKQKEKKAALKKQFQELAEKAGLSLDEILSLKKEPKKAKVKYRKESCTWSGRGRRPAWVVELEEKGGNIEEFLVKE